MKRALAICLMVGVVAWALVYNIRARNASPPKPTAQSIGSGEAAVTATPVRRRAMRRTLTLVGLLKSDANAAISPKVPGRILSILVREGQQVRAGQPLAQMDIGDMQAQVGAAAAAVRAAEAQARKATDGKAARATEIDGQIAQAAGGLRIAQAKLKQAELGVTLGDSSAISDSERAAAGVRQAEAGLRQAEVGLAAATDMLKRLKYLYEHGGVAKADLDGAQAQVDIARAQRDAARAGVAEAKAAAKPASESVPLRRKVSQADVEAARAGVRQAEEGLRLARRARAQALKIADRDVDAARAQVDQARQGQRIAAGTVGGAVLTAPINGIISGLTARPGEYAQPGLALMSVVGRGTVYLELAVAARDASAVHAGQPVDVTLDAHAGEPVTGRVTGVMPVASSDNRTVPVRVALPGPANRLVAGSLARARIELYSDPRALAIPVDAVRNEGDLTYAYAVVDGKTQRRNLRLGTTDGVNTQVLGGLREGELVVVTAPASLQTGMSVHVVGR